MQPECCICYCALPSGKPAPAPVTFPPKNPALAQMLSSPNTVALPLCLCASIYPQMSCKCFDLEQVFAWQKDGKTSWTGKIVSMGLVGPNLPQSSRLCLLENWPRLQATIKIKIEWCLQFGPWPVSDSQYNSAAAAKSLQLCPTLCDPTDGSPPGSTIPGILQARTLEWVVISLFNAWKWKVKVKLLSHVQLLVTPWTAAYQAPLSMGFSRQEYWNGLPLPSPSVQLTASLKNTNPQLAKDCCLCLSLEAPHYLATPVPLTNVILMGPPTNFSVPEEMLKPHLRKLY